MDDDQQFCLRWNNHQSTLISVFDTLLEKGMHVDCTLAAEGQTLKAHKVVLSACSPYFEAVLSQQYDKHPIIILKDVKFAEMRAMMDYMYRGEVNISQDQLGALLKAAESLQIKGLSDSKPPAARSHSPASKQPRSIRTSPTLENNMSREGSVSPTRRKKKKPRSAASASPTPLALTTPTLNNNVNSHSNHENNLTANKESTMLKSKTENTNDSNVELKSEFTYYGNDSVEDLTMEEVDSETELSGAGTSHIIPHDASGLAWSMERSHDENVPEGNAQDVDDNLDIKAEKSTTTDIPIMDLDEVFDDESTPTQNETSDSKTIILRSMALKFDQTEEKESESAESDKKSDSKNEPLSDSVDSEKTTKSVSLRSSRGREYECQTCRRKYSARKNLVRHMNLECGREPQYKCPHCPHGNHRRNELKRHIQKKHSVKK